MVDGPTLRINFARILLCQGIEGIEFVRCGVEGWADYLKRQPLNVSTLHSICSEHSIEVMSQFPIHHLVRLVPKQPIVEVVNVPHVQHVVHVLVLGDVLEPQLARTEQGVSKYDGVVLKEIADAAAWRP